MSKAEKGAPALSEVARQLAASNIAIHDMTMALQAMVRLLQREKLSLGGKSTAKIVSSLDTAAVTTIQNRRMILRISGGELEMAKDGGEDGKASG